MQFASFLALLIAKPSVICCMHVKQGIASGAGAPLACDIGAAHTTLSRGTCIVRVSVSFMLTQGGFDRMLCACTAFRFAASKRGAV